MDINIREHIINNFKDDDFKTLMNAIDESVKEGDEVTLPGMGVFFELIWSLYQSFRPLVLCLLL